MLSPCGVLNAFYGNINVLMQKHLNDQNGRMFILEVTIEESEYVLVNIYNANTEHDQLKTIENLTNLGETLITSITKT